MGIGMVWYQDERSKFTMDAVGGHDRARGNEKMRVRKWYCKIACDACFRLHFPALLFDEACAGESPPPEGLKSGGES